MCLSLPGLVISVEAQVAEIDSLGRRRRASILARPEVKPGDWVVFEAGLVFDIVTAEEAAAITESLEELDAALALEADGR